MNIVPKKFTSQWGQARESIWYYLRYPSEFIEKITQDWHWPEWSIQQWGRFFLVLSWIIASGVLLVNQVRRRPEVAAFGFWQGKYQTAVATAPEYLELTQLPPVPIADPAAADQLTATLSAQSIVIIDVPSGTVILDKNANQVFSPASTTKMMTALVAHDTYAADQAIQVGEAAFATGNTAGLVLGEELSLADMLKALLIPSGNDAAFAIAAAHPEGYEGFIDDMNQAADELGLSNTTFTNPSGLDQPTHLTTAFELSVIAREVLLRPQLKEIVGTRQAVITDLSGQRQHYLTNTHQLLGVIPAVKGVKTGTTENAKQTLVTYLEDDHQVIIVLLGSEDRYGETEQLISWLNDTVRWVELDDLDQYNELQMRSDQNFSE